MMRKILIPTDFSENSWNSITYALQLFKNETCNFILLNTYMLNVYQSEYIQTSNIDFELFNITKKTSEKGLQELLQKINETYKNPKHTFSQISSFNTLSIEISQLFESNMVDMIVMGTKGATGLSEILFGSNTVHVLKNAQCPVLAIPSGFTFEKPHDILFPSDYEVDFKENHVKPIIDIAKTHNARVNILHVFYENNLSEKQEKNLTKLTNYLKKVVHLFHNIKNKNIPEAITDFQHKNRINLLVLINNKHSFFENLFFKNTINQIGFHLNVPFLVIPSKK